jgi:hypothetical protein
VSRAVSLFRRRKSPPGVHPTSHPDWVAVETDKLDQWIESMAAHAAPLHEQEPPAWLDLARSRQSTTQSSTRLMKQTDLAN